MLEIRRSKKEKNTIQTSLTQNCHREILDSKGQYYTINVLKNHLLCSDSKPLSLILLASCCAFFFNLQALEASLFFSFLEVGRTLKGSSLTGVMSLMILPSLSSSLPMLKSFLALGVKSLPSPKARISYRENRRGKETVTFPSLPTVLDAPDGAVGAEDGIRDLVEVVWVLHFALHHQSLPFGPLGLHVVLPEVSLLLAA